MDKLQTEKKESKSHLTVKAEEIHRKKNRALRVLERVGVTTDVAVVEGVK